MGSLAGTYGSEQVAIWEERAVVIDNAPAAPVEVGALTPEGGALKVRWRQQLSLPFASYESCRATGNDVLSHQAATEDRNVASWVIRRSPGTRYQIRPRSENGRVAVGEVREGLYSISDGEHW